MNEAIFEIKEEEKKQDYSKFVISPLANGYGHTLGNSLRRVLLTSLPGSAITKVKISGVKHQFSTLKGMKEDVVDFLLSLKKVRLSVGDDKPFKLSLSVQGPKEVRAGDLKVPANVKIANPGIILANVAKGAKLEVELEAESGVGYSLAEERMTNKIGVIPLDATFSPIQRVNFKVEETRVGRLTNFDKLILEIWTDSTVSAKNALVEASKILVTYFDQIVSPKKVKHEEELKPIDSLGAMGKLSVEEIGLPTRVANALIKAGYDTVETLINVKREDLVNVRNLGEKSLKIIKLALLEKGVEFKNA
ncbi:DNA-directed RNA polymerase subunit alpha [Candidatus Woesebacteria bacterium RIFCSPHIGHO2_02_FULL_38_9]|uniref:DNA-directed RNA polymerase subunit alpha n=1 Tax=Candidatus Woesebacteria bacterium RIFCSPHIGHO2_01_FULL_39_28 TaxID=1802496 RepID=A0A1F7YA62_9BACT|nr:MAG: DNA-directed RNA polymerase subunit alpha [Candidatus Woesebacteria bacterium RIFCSPHIGHO2_01_FULL_39_28]OGM32227.1 MAG: DNA-directed RNA polymerase subunit alpha [Candidatus Woesebacteria bacterium RIFCSPHIGHO2_02_FULL_38_9]OGM58451.1 MAG: DNA-directed RNA polymerase subunit alpha [Candidatus Woesebacteria bacterium RIFCSPLOWO2_01_FULL_38_20]